MTERKGVGGRKVKKRIMVNQFGLKRMVKDFRALGQRVEVNSAVTKRRCGAFWPHRADTDSAL